MGIWHAKLDSGSTLQYYRFGKIDIAYIEIGAADSCFTIALSLMHLHCNSTAVHFCMRSIKMGSANLRLKQMSKQPINR